MTREKRVAPAPVGGVRFEDDAVVIPESLRQMAMKCLCIGLNADVALLRWLREGHPPDAISRAIFETQAKQKNIFYCDGILRSMKENGYPQQQTFTAYAAGSAGGGGAVVEMSVRERDHEAAMRIQAKQDEKMIETIRLRRDEILKLPDGKEMWAKVVQRRRGEHVFDRACPPE